MLMVTATAFDVQTSSRENCDIKSSIISVLSLRGVVCVCLVSLLYMKNKKCEHENPKIKCIHLYIYHCIIIAQLPKCSIKRRQIEKVIKFMHKIVEKGKKKFAPQRVRRAFCLRLCVYVVQADAHTGQW